MPEMPVGIPDDVSVCAAFGADENFRDRSLLSRREHPDSSRARRPRDQAFRVRRNDGGTDVGTRLSHCEVSGFRGIFTSGAGLCSQTHPRSGGSGRRIFNPELIRSAPDTSGIRELSYKCFEEISALPVILETAEAWRSR